MSTSMTGFLIAFLSLLLPVSIVAYMACPRFPSVPCHPQHFLNQLAGIDPTMVSLGLGVVPLSFLELCRICGWEVRIVGYRPGWTGAPERSTTSGVSLIFAGVGCSLITYQYCTPGSVLHFWLAELGLRPASWNSTLTFLFLNTFLLLAVLEFSRWMGSSRSLHDQWESSSPAADTPEYSMSYTRILAPYISCTIIHHIIPYAGIWRYYTMVMATTPCVNLITKQLYFLWLWNTPNSAMLRGKYSAEVEPVIKYIVNLFWPLPLFVLFRTSTTPTALAVVSHLVGAVIYLLQVLEVWRWMGYEVRVVDGWPHMRMRSEQRVGAMKTE